jgi:pimeloyl-ACP methyl ester carboxylesterase
MHKLIASLVLVVSALLSPVAVAQSDKPTIVLVHGAFAEASSWNGVVAILQQQGYPVVAVANPLRSVKGDAKYLGDIVDSIKTPVVLAKSLIPAGTSKDWSLSLPSRQKSERLR